MSIFFHVRSAKVWPLIRKEGGLRAGTGVCGDGVYLWDDLEHAEMYADLEGYEKRVIILVTSDEPIRCEEALGHFPENEGDREFYEHVFIVPLQEKKLWIPESMRRVR